MDFEELLNENTQRFTNVVSHCKDISIDIDSLIVELENYRKELHSIVLEGDSLYLFHDSHYLEPKVQLASPVNQYILVYEGNNFDLFYDLEKYYLSNRKEEAKKILDRIEQLAFSGDVNAKVAISMCKYCGYFFPQSTTTYREELNDYVRYHKNATAASLLAQYHYFNLYALYHNQEDLKYAKILMDFALEQGSKMARAFYDRFGKL